MSKKKVAKNPKQPPRLAKTQAKNAFREAFISGSVIYTSHASKRMATRGVDANDLLSLSKDGFVHYEGEPDITTGDWKYSIESLFTGLKAVFRVASPSVIIITVITSTTDKKKK